ncbi:MAG: 1-acyl-sn-glycerol-3-phosphate acyltransferase [Candidatus Eremiobacteraeota bacterium]|nr:1-acyl-sn-glycerol-3-phosphate acyltransferase [Candidatus Eremiobacteraeota bacterium]MBV8353995.1 1-acyl-sn-glycerol-3-phosphate acyltransferase [Candidatus Eremiobacteraeota bacterium]
MISTIVEDVLLREPPVYHFGRLVCDVLCYGALRMQVSGREHVPREGGLIVACNHISYVDPVALGCAFPRPISYMAKVELFRIPVFGRLLAALDAYPVDRGKGDVAAIRASVRELRAGKAIGIFPEGTRNLAGDAQVHTGVALLASLADAPVVPAFVRGGDRARRLGKLKVAFGEPLRMGNRTGGKASREELEKWTAQVMARVRALGEMLGAN